MDYEDIGNLSNFTHDITPEESSRFIAHEIIFTLFSIVGICANIAIIYTIFFFKRLRLVPNVFLANWAIADLCSLIVTPSGYRIISVIDHLPLTHEFMCFLFETGAVLHTTVIIFATTLAIDWALAAYFKKASDRFRKYYKYTIAGLWIQVIIFCAVSVTHCINYTFFFLPELMLVCTYGILLLVVIVLQTTRGIQKCRKRPLEYPTQILTLLTAFVLAYVLAFLNMTFMQLIGYHPLIAIISACMIFSSSIVNFILLYRCNKDFQACFLHVLRRTGPRYQESIAEFDNPLNDDDDGKCSVQVAFHNPTEELLTNAY